MVRLLAICKNVFRQFLLESDNQNNFDIPVCPADVLVGLQADPVSQACKYKAVNSNIGKDPGNRI